MKINESKPWRSLRNHCYIIKTHFFVLRKVVWVLLGLKATKKKNANKNEKITKMLKKKKK